LSEVPTAFASNPMLGYNGGYNSLVA